LKVTKYMLVLVVAAGVCAALVFAIAVAFYVMVGAPAPGSSAYVIPTTAMSPTIVPGDRVVCDAGRSPVPGSIVVIKDPTGQHPALVKRLVAFSGQSVEVTSGALLVDGQPEPWADELVEPTEPGTVQTPLTVPEGQVWVMGDNRPSSGDSRHFGPVPEDLVIGVVTHIYWPPSRFGPAATEASGG
jgi:signal peptidase I